MHHLAQRCLPHLPRRLAALALGLATAVAALAQPPALPPQDVLHLQAEASVEVPRDWLVLSLAAQREGVDAATVQAELQRALGAALAEARRAAQPGQIEVATGAFALWPRVGPRGVTTGWQGRAELLVQGRDLEGIARLAGRLTTMSVAGVSQRLSREAQQRVEAEVIARAVERFRAQAGEVARLFGHTGYTLREVTVSVGGDSPRPPPMLRAEAMVAAAEAALPVEPGRGAVTATVSGSVQMR
jgi:predicted secreted protein